MKTTTIKDLKRTPNPVSVMSAQFARAAVAFPALFIVLLVLLHVLKPEVDPSWQPISEYALGPNGFIMMAAFLAMGCACVALFLTLRSQTQLMVGKIAFAFLLLSAIGFLLGGIFETDPVNVDQSAATLSGHLHGLGATLGGLIPFALLFLTIALVRNENWKKEKKWLWTITMMAWAADILFAAVMINHISQSDGRFGPETPVGWYNRLMIITYAICVLWMGLISLGLRRHSHTEKDKYENLART